MLTRPRSPTHDPAKWRWRRRLRSAGLVVLLWLVTACGGGGAETPQALFGEIQDCVRRQDWAGFYAAMHPAAQRKQLREIENAKQLLRNNREEGNERVYQQFNYATKAEFLAADPMAIWDRMHSHIAPNTMDDSRLGDEIQDPERPNDRLFQWWTAADQRQLMRVRLEDGGWHLVDLTQGSTAE